MLTTAQRFHDSHAVGVALDEEVFYHRHVMLIAFRPLCRRPCLDRIGPLGGLKVYSTSE